MDTLLYNLVRLLNVALVNMRVYAPDHPTTAASVQKAFGVLSQMVQDKGELSLGVVENTLLVGEAPVEGADAFIVKFVEELVTRNIDGLVFYPEISEDEFRVFLDCMSQDPDRLTAGGGVQSFLESRGVSHVVANEVRYAKIKDSLNTGEGLDEAVIAAFLMGKVPALPGDQKDLGALLEEAPAKVAEMIDAGLSEVRERGGNESELARSANRAIERMVRLVESKWGGSEKCLGIMARIVFSLSPDAQAAIYRYRADHADRPEDRLDSIVTDFSDQEAIRLICNVYRGGLRSPEILARVVKKVLPTQERRKRIAQDLGRELIGSGMGEEAWESLKDEILWESFTLGQKVERLASRTQLAPSDLVRIRQVAPKLAEERMGPEMARLLKALVAGLKTDDPETRRAVASYLGQFYGIVEDSGRFKRADLFFLKKLIGAVKGEEEQHVREAILQSLAAILKREILEARFRVAARALLALSRLGFLEPLIQRCDSLVSQDLTDQLTGALGQGDKTRRDEALAILRLLGRAVLESVLFALEREENPDVRRRLVSVVRSMGKEITGEIVHRLADNRWYVVQTALYVLAEIGDKTLSPDLLTSSVYHEDIRVRKQAVKTLSRLGGKGSTRILCELLKDGNEEIRLLALRALGEAGDNMAVPYIIPLVEKKKLKGFKSDVMRQTAMEVLGKIGDPRAVPVLLGILRSKGVFKKEDETIRKVAVQALGAIRDPELEGVLREVLESEADSGVREAARRALLNLNPPEDRNVSASAP
ncbi:MAG: HEAT repeat domain-containing protein [Deltaproteobacteria bacterium]|nr:HEAT repeat domain-containing protein [Deltaproteobacteria bacterium]